MNESITIGTDTYYYKGTYFNIINYKKEAYQTILKWLFGTSTHIMFINRTQSTYAKRLEKYIEKTTISFNWLGISSLQSEVIKRVPLTNEVIDIINSIPHDIFFNYPKTVIEDISFVCDDTVLAFCTSHENLLTVTEDIILSIPDNDIEYW